jgi:hypothetical protein
VFDGYIEASKLRSMTIAVMHSVDYISLQFID